ncbi:hypothetical protein Syun_014840 [Stephania yunnanensis]|uniref:Uncharacterized protein n=1 Tax=Stephania yunnanensis TaxID=152371 RepID=A0AAP0JM92_9MAGN
MLGRSRSSSSPLRLFLSSLDNLLFLSSLVFLLRLDNLLFLSSLVFLSSLDRRRSSKISSSSPGPRRSRSSKITAAAARPSPTPHRSTVSNSHALDRSDRLPSHPPTRSTGRPASPPPDPPPISNSLTSHRRSSLPYLSPPAPPRTAAAESERASSSHASPVRQSPPLLLPPSPTPSPVRQSPSEVSVFQAVGGATALAGVAAGVYTTSFPESSPLHLAARGGSLDCVRESASCLLGEQIDRKELSFAFWK